MRRDPIVVTTCSGRQNFRVGQIFAYYPINGKVKYSLVTKIDQHEVVAREVSIWFVRWHGVKGWCRRLVVGAIERVRMLWL